MGCSLLGFESGNTGIKKGLEAHFSRSQDVSDSLLLHAAHNSLGSCVHLLVLLGVNALPALGECLVSGNESLVCRLHIY